MKPAIQRREDSRETGRSTDFREKTESRLIFHSSQVPEKLERETGVEPATSSLGKWAMFCFQ
jgi:hypothetical protein